MAGRKHEADRMAAMLAANLQRAEADEEARVANERRGEIRTLERRVMDLIPQVLEGLAATGYPGLEPVEVHIRRRGLAGVFRGDRHEHVAAFRVSQYPIPESMGGPAGVGYVRLLVDGRLYVGGGAIYPLGQFTEKVLEGQGLGRKPFSFGREPFTVKGLQNIIDGLSDLL